jgi:pimeloyl-ACP methyl ester carboxylesterase
MSAILLEGQVVHYEVLGRGRPIIFLHSWIGSWRYWIASMQIASTSFRAYALDLWGFGDTAKDPLRYSVDKQTDLLSDFLDKMGIGKIALVGHGLGSMVGFTFATRWPQSVDRIMAINSPMISDSINERMKTSPLPDLINWLGSRTPEAVSALSDAMKADPRAIAASVNGYPRNDLFASMRETQIPCLLVHGQTDPAIPVAAPDESDELPHMMHHIMLENSGHFPMIDDTVRFNRLLTDFLALDSGVSPRELQVKDEWRRRVR